MFLVQHKWPPRLVGLCMLLTLAVGSGHRLHAQTRIVGASTVPPKTIDVLQHRHGLHRTVWRRWPGSATARPKKKSSPRTERIPLPKKKEPQTGPGLKDRFPRFPLEGIDDNLPSQRSKTQPFPSGDGSLPSKPFDFKSDPAPKPTRNLKHAEPKPVETVPPKRESVPSDATLPDGGAAISRRGRDYQARRAPTIRSGRYDRQPPAARYQTGRARVLEPATHYAPRRTGVNRPSQGRGPQGRFDNPLRSGMRTAHAPLPSRAVPVANWSAQGARDARLAETIRTSVSPRYNPLRP